MALQEGALFNRSEIEEDFSSLCPVKTNYEWTLSRLSEAEVSRSVNVGDFTSLFKSAGILDTKTLPIQGAQIWLPYGNLILDTFSSRVKSLYARFGFEEYSYPAVVCTDIFSPMGGFQPVKEKLLYIRNPHDIDSEKLALSPTGEASIYTHWKQLVKNTPLPIKMFQKTTYFRPKPKRVAGSILKGFEAKNVFEFHCCLSTEADMNVTVIQNVNMLRTLYAELDIPVIWSTRPIWTNNHRVHHGAHAADLFLPFGKTMQLSAVYKQGTIFSEAYDIKFDQGGKRGHTFHSTGYCSQRALLGFIMLSSYTAGRFLVPPTISPFPVEVFMNWDAEDSYNFEDVIRKNIPVNVRITRCQSQRDVEYLIKQSAKRGTPLTVVIQGKRSPQDRYKIILIRRDKNAEHISYQAEITTYLPELISDTLSLISKNISFLNRSYIRDNFHNISSREELSAHTGGKIVFVPLGAEEHAVLSVEKIVKGEVIGFIGGKEEQCIITGKNTSTRAILCRRM